MKKLNAYQVWEKVKDENLNPEQHRLLLLENEIVKKELKIYDCLHNRYCDKQTSFMFCMSKKDCNFKTERIK